MAKHKFQGISQRDAFWNKVYEIAKHDRDVVIVSADMGAPSLDKFRRDLAGQFVNVGIAEQNAIVVAAGLALSGKKVFAYAIAPFITLRCLEQIRLENGAMQIPVCIVGVGAGFSYEDSGPTHHLVEDLAVMRALPHIKIHSITDSVMASALAEISYQMKTTNYVRLDRQVFPDVYSKRHDFNQGLAVLRESQDCYILSCGNMAHIALEISDSLRKKGISIGVIDVYTLPINADLLLRTVKKAKRIISLEEHFLPGGLGSAICEVFNDHRIAVTVNRIGLAQEVGYCYKYGGRDLVRANYGIDKARIKKKISDLLL